jgi:Spy/CpxP family protein refolding chaperone
MKRIWMLVLLISLGLNLGLGMNLMRGRSESDQRGHPGRERDSHTNHGQHWAAEDTAARGQMIARRMDHMADLLDLAPGQREAFEKVHVETGRLLMQKRVLIAEKRDLLHSLVTGDEVDQNGIRRAIADLGREQAVLDSLVAETVLQEMEVLDPHQRGQYLEMLSFEKGGRGNRRGRGRAGVPHQ